MLKRRFLILFTVALGFSLLYLLLTPQSAEEARHAQVDMLADTYRFNFAIWELQTLLKKGNADLAAGHIYLSEAARKQLVLDYLTALNLLLTLERQVDAIYVDPAVADPETASQALQTRVQNQRALVDRLQPLAEAILEEQIAAVLLDEGFGVLGHPWPPVRAHLTPLPSLLVVSPRDVIQREYAVSLEPGLLTPEREALETAVFAEVDHAAYVTDIGGLGTYPSMIIETSNLNFLVEVIAHEWTHHWLSFYPLGYSYSQNGALRTMNESTANILGKEVGTAVINRYYPEFAPPPPGLPAEPLPQPEPPPFDFRLEMAETRVQVERLLAAGDIARAEAYMEAQRQVFVANGYRLRVLNQAYFAFHGAYADVVGAAGADPVGPAVVALRAGSPSLKSFMNTMAFITSLEELEGTLEELEN